MDFTNALSATNILPESSVVVDAFITIHWPPFRKLTVTDVDKFIQIPVTIQVDATDNVLTTTEDVMSNYDPILCTDYAIYVDLPKSSFFNMDSMTWQYQVVKFPHTGEVHMVDAGFDFGAPYDVTEPVINTESLVHHLSSVTKTTRFVHYKQANTFFKYSFRVGDQVQLSDGRKAQLWAVYLDTDDGNPQPYFFDLPRENEYAPEHKVFICAEMPADADIMYTPVDTGIPVPVNFLCPPDSEFLQHGPLGTNLTGTDASGLLIFDVRNIPNMTAYSSMSNFVMYSDLPEDEHKLSLYMYYVVEPEIEKPYLGETLQFAYASSLTAMPARDPSPINTDLGDRSMSFLIQEQVDIGVFHAAENGPKMMYPVSYFNVKPSHSEPILTLPVQYDKLNQTDMEYRKLSMGGRFMQLVSEYMFDASSEREMNFFPFLLEEARSLNGKIVEQLASLIQRSSDVRNEILRQILIKYGRKYFEEYEVMRDDTRGNAVDVISKLDELFIYFTVSMLSSVSNRTKDKVDSILLDKIPVVFRLYQ